MKQNRLAPAQLWTGTHDSLIAEVIPYLQKRFCTDDGCGVCVACNQIREQQHHAIVWICPEKNYTLDDLKIIHERLSFALYDDQEIFFILQKADFLSKQCANSLLKSIEEPPEGYHFILCAERTEYVLPTIKSRCLLRTFAQDAFTGQLQQLYTGFTAQQQEPLAFLQYLQKNPLNEQQTLDLVDQLLAYWMHKYKDAIEHNKEKKEITKRITILKNALLKPPMPGSSKLFWKNLYMQFNACS
jgi:DNA polymerase-3 subunit delta'